MQKKNSFFSQDLDGLVQAKTNLKNLFNDLNRFRFLLGVSSTTKPIFKVNVLSISINDLILFQFRRLKKALSRQEIQHQFR